MSQPSGSIVTFTILSLATSLVWACDRPRDEEQNEEEPAAVSCDEPLSTEDPGEGAPVDFQPGIEDELAALDLSTLPDTIDISELTGLHRGFIAYTLEMAPEDLGPSLERSELETKGILGELLLGSFQLGEAAGSGMDFFFFRRGFQRYYSCSRGLPLSLEDFKSQVFDYSAIDGETVDSAAKCGDRYIRTSPADGVYVAETVIDGSVRETEILLNQRRTDGQLDYVTYDSDGQLTDRSQFPTLSGETHIAAASPYVCMTCHFNASASETTWGFDVLVPSAGPCQDL